MLQRSDKNVTDLIRLAPIKFLFRHYADEIERYVK
jgi:hypothetical protein